MKDRFKRAIFLVLLLIFVLPVFASCGISRYEYEVISIAKYEVVVGTDKNGPITENKLTFIFLRDGEPVFVRKFADDGEFNYVLIGDKNLYMTVDAPGEFDRKYLYLTQETYDKLFPERIETAEQETISNSKEETTNDNSEYPDPDQDH